MKTSTQISFAAGRSKWLAGLLLAGAMLLSRLDGYGQTYATSQVNQVNGICVLCGVVNDNNPINNANLTDYSQYAITVGLLGVSVEQTLIFPSASPNNGCDSLIVGIGSNNALLTLSLFGGVVVETYNGATSNNDAQVVSGTILRLLSGNTRAELALKPAQTFDRVKITLVSTLVGALDGLRIYYAYNKPGFPSAPLASGTGTLICSGQTATVSTTPVSGIDVSWYDQASGGTLLGTGNTYVSPTLTANATYYAQANIGSCLSASRTAITVSVNTTPPAAPTATGAVICSGQSTTLNATSPSGASFNWYTQASGGSSIYTGASYATPTLTTNTTYYVESFASACTSVSRTPVTVTVSTTAPAAPTITGNLTTCIGQVGILSATAPPGATFSWYTQASGGIALASGSSYTTSPLISNTTLYVESNLNGCTSTSRTAVTLTVNTTIPDPPTALGGIICTGQSAILDAIAPAGVTFNWYTQPTGGTSLYTGAHFSTPTLTNNVIYYVESTLGGCNSLIRTPVTVTVNLTSPAAPTVSGITICSGQTATLSATAPAGSIFNWFNQASGGASVNVGNVYVTPTLTANTTYYVESLLNACSSASRTAVTVNVNSILPAAPTTTTNIQLCTGQTATLSASGPGGAILNWYSQPTGGLSISTGTTYVTPTLTTNATYYVESLLNTCTSASRTAVAVTINTVIPNAPTTTASVSICTGQSATLTPSGPAGASFVFYNQNIGGVSLSTGPSFSTPTLTASTTYYVESLLNACSSASRTAVAVNVSTVIPAAPSAASATICTGQSATITATAPSGAAFEWYTQASGGAPVSSGTSYSSPTLTASTTYYVESWLGACSSASRTPVTITVNTTIPAAPTVGNLQICTGQTATLSATAPIGVQFNWYNQAAGGASINAGATYVTPTLSTSATYYVESLLNACTSASRTAVAVSVNTVIPNAPTAIGLNICTGQTATLTPSAPAGATFVWYNQASGGASVASGASYTTPTLTTSTTFYVESLLNACTSASRTAVAVTVNTLVPVAPTAAGTTICTGQSTTLTATAPSGASFLWYNQASGGASVNSGTNYATPTLTSSTIYYVESWVGACSSTSRTAVTVNVNNTNPPAPAAAGALICTGQSATLTATAPAGANFDWYTLATGGSSVHTGSVYATPALTANTTYYVESMVSGCRSLTRTSVSVSVNTTPPAAPTAAGTLICTGQNATLSATSPSGVVFNWYQQSSGGSSIGSGPNYSTPTLTASATYYVESFQNACTSVSRTPVSVIVNTVIPNAPIANDTMTCIGLSVNIPAISPAGATFNWYTQASGSTPVYTGSVFATPSLTANTTYYVEAILNACTSSTRTAVTVTVDPASGPFNVNWTNAYGGTMVDQLRAALATPDHGFLMAGSSNSDDGDLTGLVTYPFSDFWAVKTDSVGNIQWKRKYGGEREDELMAAAIFPGGDYLLVGYTASNNGAITDGNNGNIDAWIMKVSKTTGVKMWDRTLGGSGVDQLNSVVSMGNGNFLLGGYTTSSNYDITNGNNGMNDYWVCMIDSTGHILWDKTYGGSNQDRLRAIVKVPGGGFLLGGSSSSANFDVTDGNNGGTDMWIVRITSNGGYLWDKSYGGSNDDDLYTMSLDVAGTGYILGGSTASNNLDVTNGNNGGLDAWIVGVNGSGVKQWDMTYGGNLDETMRTMLAVPAGTSGGTYFFAGETFSNNGDVTDGNYGDSEGWMVKADSAGVIDWDRTLGGTELDGFCAIVPMSNGLLVAGNTESDNYDVVNPTHGNSDYWLSRVYYSCAVPRPAGSGNTGSPSVSNPYAASADAIKVYPNPFQQTLTFEVPAGENDTIVLAIYAVDGKLISTNANKVYDKGVQRIQIDLGNAAPGVYFGNVIANGKTSVYKVIKLQ